MFNLIAMIFTMQGGLKMSAIVVLLYAGYLWALWRVLTKLGISRLLILFAFAIDAFSLGLFRIPVPAMCYFATIYLAFELSKSVPRRAASSPLLMIIAITVDVLLLTILGMPAPPSSVFAMFFMTIVGSTPVSTSDDRDSPCEASYSLTQPGRPAERRGIFASSAIRLCIVGMISSVIGLTVTLQMIIGEATIHPDYLLHEPRYLLWAASPYFAWASVAYLAAKQRFWPLVVASGSSISSLGLVLVWHDIHQPPTPGGMNPWGGGPSLKLDILILAALQWVLLLTVVTLMLARMRLPSDRGPGA